MRILFTGGGTLGSVTPLLAVFEELQKTKNITARDVFWIGTQRGPEAQLIKEYGISFVSVCAGKLRRYFSWRNFFDPLLLFIGIVQSFFYILRFRPDVLVSAGGYVAVPVIWAGWLCGKKSVILQLDIRPSLANVITSYFAEKIGVALDEEARFFPKKKTSIVGIPVRDRALVEFSTHSRSQLRKCYGFTDALPVLLVLGGGTGSTALNTLVTQSLDALSSSMHIVHITGKEKMIRPQVDCATYHQFDFLTTELSDYIALADVVITRARMRTLSELSTSAKPTIIIPLPDSHQELNAAYFEKKQAAVYMGQKTLTSEKFIRIIKRVLSSEKEKKELSAHIATIFPNNSRELVVNLLYESSKRI